MTVDELILELKQFPGNTNVEVNDNICGNCFDIDQVDFFANEEDGHVVVIQVNCR